MANNQQGRDCLIIGTIVVPLIAFGPMRLGAQEQSADFAAVAARCAPSVHITTLGALVRQESGGNPYRININGAAALARQPRNAGEAVSTAQWLVANGYNIDMGLGQINVSNLGWLGLSYADAFKPCDNLNATARILLDDYQRSATTMGEGQPALRAAFSYYNTGSPQRGFRNGYVQKVIDQAGRPIPSIVPPIEVSGSSATPMEGSTFESHSNVTTQVPTTQGKVHKRVSQTTDNKGEPDVFSASADRDAFMVEPELRQNSGGEYSAR